MAPFSAIAGLNLFLLGYTNNKSDSDHTCLYHPLPGIESGRDQPRIISNWMRKPMRSLIGAVVGAFCLAAPAVAETPAAIVEDVQGKVDGIEFMDYVAPGKIIKLGPKATITLSYLKSCQRETISEGVVMVGTEQSTVQLGEVKREKVPCDTNAAKLSEREANQSAATTFRTMRSDAKGSAPAKLPTLYGIAPLVQAKSGSPGDRAHRWQGAHDQRAAQERDH